MHLVTVSHQLPSLTEGGSADSTDEGELTDVTHVSIKVVAVDKSLPTQSAVVGLLSGVNLMVVYGPSGVLQRHTRATKTKIDSWCWLEKA